MCWLWMLTNINQKNKREFSVLTQTTQRLRVSFSAWRRSDLVRLQNTTGRWPVIMARYPATYPCRCRYNVGVDLVRIISIIMGTLDSVLSMKTWRSVDVLRDSDFFRLALCWWLNNARELSRISRLSCIMTRCRMLELTPAISRWKMLK